jgi:hypothetical protein
MEGLAFEEGSSFILRLGRVGLKGRWADSRSSIRLIPPALAMDGRAAKLRG